MRNPLIALRDVGHFAPNPVKRRAALILTLLVVLPVVLIVGTGKVLRYLWLDLKDNIDYVFGEIPGDIRDRWHGVGITKSVTGL